MKINALKAGDRVQYDSPTVIDGNHWVWQPRGLCRSDDDATISLLAQG
jgi:hypothetical protein